MPRSRRYRRRGFRPRKLVFFTLAIFGLAAGIVWWIERPPGNPDDICAIFAEKRSWYISAKDAFDKWGVPEAVQMAVIFHESSFRARARPPRRKFLWILHGRRLSSAYGYAQVLDGTWKQFVRDTGRPDAARYRFDDVTHFVGWYGTEIERLTGIAKNDPYRLYLAYHEGPGGYQRGSHNAKPWLLKVARRVESRAGSYQRRYDGCKDRLWWVWLWEWTWRLAVFAFAVWLLLRWWRRPRRKKRRRQTRRR